MLVPPAVWCPPAGPPRCCVPPCGGRVPRVLPRCPPPAVGSCPVCWCPPAVYNTPTDTIAMTTERLQR